MRFIFRQTSLFFKVIFVASLILIFAISFNVWWNTSLHGSSIEKLTHEKTKIISEFIEENVVRAMEKGRHFDMHRILKNTLVTRMSGGLLSSARMERSGHRHRMMN